MIWPFRAILRGSTLEGTRFTIAVDLSIITSYSIINYELGQNFQRLNTILPIIGFLLYVESSN
jgi:hypothetical protein